MQLLNELEELQWQLAHSTDNMTIRVPKTKVLETLKKNRANQVALQEKAASRWKEELATRLEDSAAAIRAGNGVPQDVNDIIKDLARPSNVIKAYDDAIMMFEWETREEVELDGTQFKQFIQDDWTWKQQWTVSNSKYLGG